MGINQTCSVTISGMSSSAEAATRRLFVSTIYGKFAMAVRNRSCMSHRKNAVVAGRTSPVRTMAAMLNLCVCGSQISNAMQVRSAFSDNHKNSTFALLMRAFVRLPSSLVMTLDVRSSTTLAALKHHIAQSGQTDLSPCDQRIVHNGALLEVRVRRQLGFWFKLMS